MGSVVELMRRAADTRRTVRGMDRPRDELGAKIAQVIKAIDDQKAEIAVFRERMESLRAEMSSLDASVATYRSRMNRIPHRQLHQQARNLATLMEAREAR